MASQKEYEMLYKLNAQIGSSFSSTFTSAQQQIVNMQGQIESLNSLQSDISAYEKQQQAVDNTKSKLELLQKQYANIEKEMQETGNYSSDLENKLLTKQQQIDKTSSSLENQTSKLEQMGTALQDAGVDTDNLTSESERLESEMKDVKEAQENVADSAEDMGEKGTGAISDIDQLLATVGIVAALKEIADAFKECVNVAAGFESTMSTVEAISGATSEEMDELTQCAKDLGSTTMFSAQESAEAMTYMAMAGWETEDMLSGMQGVMDLAAASGEDLAEVSDIVTDALTAFGMEASDSAHFADVLAATAANSNTSVSQMGETFKNVAPIAGTLGYSVEDVSVMMGLMADNGIKSSVAGTALKNTLNGLASGCTLTCDALGDYEVSVINSDGTTKDLDETIDELRWAFSQMSEQEKISNAQAIAGTRSYSGLLAILNATDDQYDELTETINNCSGAASEMAEIKMDNMTGSLTIMQSAWEGLKITIGEQFTPVLSNLYDMLAGVISWVNDFIQQNPIVIKLLAAVAAGVTAFAAAIGIYTAATKIAKAVTDAFGDSLKAIPFVAIATAVAGITAAVIAFASNTDDSRVSVEELTEAGRTLTETMDSVTAEYNDSIAAAESAAGVAGDYVDKLFDMQEAGIDSEEAQDEFNGTCERLLALMPEMSDYIVQTTDEYGNLKYEIIGTKKETEALIETQKEQAIAEAYNTAMEESYSAYADATVELTKDQKQLEEATENVKAAEENRTNAINEISDALLESSGYTYDELEGMGLLEGQISKLDQEYIDMYNSIGEYNDEIVNGRDDMAAYEKAVKEDEDALANAENQVNINKEAYEEYADEINAAAAKQEELDSQTEAFTGEIDDVIAQIDDLTDRYNDVYEAAYNSVSGQYDLWDEAAEVTATSVDTINDNLESQINYWDDYNKNLDLVSGYTDDIEGLGDVLAGFADGSTESVNAIAGLADALAEGDTTQVEQMVQQYQELQDKQVEVSDSIAQLAEDYEQEFQDLVDQVGEDIENLNLSDEATDAAKETLQGYIDGAEDMDPLVKSAYEAVAQSANNALDGIKKQLQVNLSVSSDGATITTTAYAQGTNDASQGVALVGEEGPELVYFNGGEQVIPNDETRQLLALAGQDNIAAYAEGTELAAFIPQFVSELESASQPLAESAIVNNNDYQNNNNVSVTINVSGNASAETLQGLQDYGDEFANRVLQIIEDHDEDVLRGAYV